jgi:hypothetical protein
MRIFEAWDERDIGVFTRLMRNFADAINNKPPAVS